MSMPDEESDNILADVQSSAAELTGGDDTATETAAPEPQEATDGQDGQVLEPSSEATSAAEVALQAQRVRDQQGRFTKSGQPAPKPAKAVATPVAKAPSLTNGKAVERQAVKATPEATADVKAPGAWSPMAKEHWSALPQEVRAEVVRREKETAVALQSAGEARQFHQAFMETVRPYEAAIRNEGVDAITATRNLFQAVSTLQSNNVVAKAHLWTQVAKTYGIPPEAIEAAWQGQLPQGGQPQGQMQMDPQTIIRQAKQEVMQEFTAQRQHVARERALTELEQFTESHDFADDPELRQEMGLLMDAATAAKRPLSLEKAYALAVASRPDISAILRQREEAKAARTANATADRSLIASSSVRSSPAVAPRNQRSGGYDSWDEGVRSAREELLAGRTA